MSPGYWLGFIVGPSVHSFGVWVFLSRYSMRFRTHFCLGSAQTSLASLVLKLWEERTVRRSILKIQPGSVTHSMGNLPGPLAWGDRGGRKEPQGMQLLWLARVEPSCLLDEGTDIRTNIWTASWKREVSIFSNSLFP